MYHFIVNPTSNSGKAKNVLDKLENILKQRNVEYCFHYTTCPKSATEITKTLTNQGETEIIAVGGDGTAHEVLNGLTNVENVNFGLIPCGSGNDFAQSAHIPTDLNKALEIILDNKPVKTDYMVCDGVKGLNIIGAGIDVEILERCKRSKLKGKLQYTVSLLISLMKFKFYDFVAKFNGKEHSQKTMIACVGNGKNFGGGIKMCPNAVIDDGLLDVVVVGNLKKSAIPKALTKLKKGVITEQPYTIFERSTHLEVQADKPFLVEIDGEIYNGIKFIVDIVKGGLNFYRLKEN